MAKLQLSYHGMICPNGTQNWCPVTFWPKLQCRIVALFPNEFGMAYYIAYSTTTTEHNIYCVSLLCRMDDQKSTLTHYKYVCIVHEKGCCHALSRHGREKWEHNILF